MDLHEPHLYAPSGDDRVVLLALRDPATGALSFPRTAYGIGATGTPAEAAEEVSISGQGKVLVSVTVHQPLSPGMATPLVVARLQLDDGIVLDGVLEGTTEPAPGSHVHAVLVPEERGGKTALACRFRVGSVA